MIIKTLIINNLQLIKFAQVDFDNLTIVSGINKDNPNESGNASGKSTFILRAILFVLYGYVEEGLTLKDLIRFEEKEAKVEIVIEKGGDYYTIVRTIPTQLQLFKNNVEIQTNTATIKQKTIDELFGDVNFFRQYRCVDLKNGINVLDLGIISLRKTLMGFIEGIFTQIRTRLLAQKVERERFSIDKKLYKHYLSEKRLNVLNTSLDEIKKEYQKLEKEKDTQQGIISQIKSEISSREKIIYNKKRELEEAQKSGICPILKIKCVQITKQITSEQKNLMNQEMVQLNQEIVQYKQQLESEEDSIGYYNDSLAMFRKKEQKAREKLLRLKGAFQFADYKYTRADIIIYDEAIKVLDTFAGEYIKEWLGSLSIILNNLLNLLNIKIEFTADKEFIRVYDGEQILKYDQLSKGQKTFLGCVFKFAILMQQNKSGLVILDDGLNDIDWINFKNLINILKTLPFQAICVYQGLQEEIEDTKHFITVRENGQSQIK